MGVNGECLGDGDNLSRSDYLKDVELSEGDLQFDYDTKLLCTAYSK